MTWSNYLEAFLRKFSGYPRCEDCQGIWGGCQECQYTGYQPAEVSRYATETADT